MRQQIFKGELYEDRRAPTPSHNGSSNSGSARNGSSSASASSAAGSKGEAVENDWREHLVPATTAGTQQEQQDAPAASSGSSGSQSGDVPQGGAQALAGSMPHIHTDTHVAGSSDSS